MAFKPAFILNKPDHKRATVISPSHHSTQKGRLLTRSQLECWASLLPWSLVSRGKTTSLSSKLRISFFSSLWFLVTRWKILRHQVPHIDHAISWLACFLRASCCSYAIRSYFYNTTVSKQTAGSLASQYLKNVCGGSVKHRSVASVCSRCVLSYSLHFFSA